MAAAPAHIITHFAAFFMRQVTGYFNDRDRQPSVKLMHPQVAKPPKTPNLASLH